MKMTSLVITLLAAAVLSFSMGCNKLSQSGDNATGTGTNSPEDSAFKESESEQVRFEGKNTQAMPAVSDQPAGEFLVTDDHVRQVQSALKAKGFDINVNGIESTETSRAVERFQSQSGLAPTGRIDEAVISKLNIKTSSDRTPSSVPTKEN